MIFTPIDPFAFHTFLRCEKCGNRCRSDPSVFPHFFSARVKVLFLRSGSLSCIRCIIWPAKLPHFLPISGIPITLHIICTESK